MSQSDFGIIDPAETSGPELAALLQNFRDAVHTHHSGSNRPPYIKVGMTWLDTNVDPWKFKQFDGSEDIVLFEVSPLNNNPIHFLGPELPISSSETTSLASVRSNRVLITGNNPISSFGTAEVGTFRWVRMAGSLQLQHSANLILPNGSNLQTAAGDTFLVEVGVADDWRILVYQHAAGGALPIGTLVSTILSTAPPGWLFCYGQNVSRTTYATLFNAIGTVFGSGDGSTTFTVPDLRGRAIFGKDDMGGVPANRITSGVSGILGTTLGASGGNQSMHNHNHGGGGTFSSGTESSDHLHQYFFLSPISNNAQGAIIRPSSGIDVWFLNYGTGSMSGRNNAHFHNTTITIPSSGAGSSQNMPPAMIFNYMVFAGA